jgi:catechol 2,3-dioxygenase-like lactoylglutathione lyase family enzyme
MLSRFDHVTIVVNDLDRAIAEQVALFGFAPRWRGQHPELGTEAALFGVGNAMIELVGPHGGSAEAEGMRAWLAEHGQGLQALAFGSDDAGACSAELRARGLRATPPQDGEARAADGSLRRYRVVELSPKHTRGVAVLVVERANAPQLMAASASLPAHVSALDHVVVRSADCGAAEAFYQRGLGLRLALDRVVAGTRLLFFRIGGVTIEIVHDPALAAEDKLWGVCYRVGDIAAAHERMASCGIALSEIRDGKKPGTLVFNVRSHDLGVPTLILHDPARA